MGEDGASFTVLTPIEDLVLAPDEEQEVDIPFEPMGDSQQTCTSGCSIKL